MFAMLSTFELLHVSELSQYGSSFVRLLGDRGIGQGVLKVVEEQKILSLRVFRAMKEDRLLQCRCMPIGEHALLWELWEKEYSASPPVVCEFILGVLLGSS